MSDLERHIKALIRHEGPISVATYMALANRHYYATRDPLGVAGDFTTAPEISQIFGELVGLCLIDFWQRSGAPSAIRLVELGPGRGTLMADALRGATLRPAFLDAARITLVETSPALRARQQASLAGHAVAWADTFAAVPDDAPLYLIANEFFDALPIRQFVKRGDAWHERLIGLDGNDNFTFALSEALSRSSVIATTSVILGARAAGTRGPMPGTSQEAPSVESLDPLRHGSSARPAGGPGMTEQAVGTTRRSERDSLAERNEPAADIAAQIAARLATHGGLALIIDYGQARSAPGDTLQAVRHHAFADPLASPGEADLTAHVDFESLAKAASPARPHGPIAQGDFLTALGIPQRAAALAKAQPHRTHEIETAVTRLTDPDQMGHLFKVLALTGPDGPIPAGFAAS